MRSRPHRMGSGCVACDVTKLVRLTGGEGRPREGRPFADRSVEAPGVLIAGTVGRGSRDGCSRFPGPVEPCGCGPGVRRRIILFADRRSTPWNRGPGPDQQFSRTEHEGAGEGLASRRFPGWRFPGRRLSGCLLSGHGPRRTQPSRPAASRPTTRAAGSVTMITRKPCSSRSAISSTPAVMPQGTSNSRHAASTAWMAPSMASASPS